MQYMGIRNVKSQVPPYTHGIKICLMFFFFPLKINLKMLRNECLEHTRQVPMSDISRPETCILTRYSGGFICKLENFHYNQRLAEQS